MKSIILFLSFAFTGVAQIPEQQLIENMNDLIQNRIKWNAVSRNEFSPAEKKVIVQFIKDSSNSFCLNYQIDGDYLSDFHLVDLDGDKDLDVIYEGFECAGYSSKTILIYLNKGNTYKNVIRIAGRIISLNPGSDLTLYRYPCCSMIDNTLISYTIKQDSLIEQFGLNFFFSFILKPVSKDYDRIIPKKLKAGNSYTIKAKTGINYVPKDSLENPIFITESLAGYIGAEVKVTSYASVTDKKGIQWLYCKVPKEVVILNNKTIDYPLMIWVKAKDCTKTDN